MLPSCAWAMPRSAYRNKSVWWVHRAPPCIRVIFVYSRGYLCRVERAPSSSGRTTAFLLERVGAAARPPRWQTRAPSPTCPSAARLPSRLRAIRIIKRVGGRRPTAPRGRPPVPPRYPTHPGRQVPAAVLENAKRVGRAKNRSRGGTTAAAAAPAASRASCCPRGARSRRRPVVCKWVAATAPTAATATAIATAAAAGAGWRGDLTGGSEECIHGTGRPGGRGAATAHRGCGLDGWRLHG